MNNIGNIKSKPLAIIAIIGLWTVIQMAALIELIKGDNNV